MHVNMDFFKNSRSDSTSLYDTGWRRLIGSLKLQIIFHKRATKYGSLLRKMTYIDKGSYESLPPCNTRMRACIHSHIHICIQTYIHGYIHAYILAYMRAHKRNTRKISRSSTGMYDNIHTCPSANTHAYAHIHACCAGWSDCQPKYPTYTATHYTTLHHTAPHRNTLHLFATHGNTLHHTATHRKQKYSTYTATHAATHGNTLQHMASHRT